MPALLLAFFLLFTGCTSPGLSVKDQTLMEIDFGKKKLALNADKRAGDFIVLNGVTVTRSLYLLDDNTTVVYEVANTQPPYRFNHDTKQSLDLVFGAAKVTTIERVGNLGFYAIAMRNGGTLLAIAQNRNKIGITMVYGVTKKQMHDAIGFTGGKPAVMLDGINDVILLPDSIQAFKSRWAPRLIIMDGLLKRAGARPYWY